MSKIKELYAVVKDVDDLKPEDNLELAHLAWLVKKETIINELTMLMQDTDSKAYKQVLSEAIKFIEEGEV